jgi:DNA-binding transcriptional regulator GbsR (MarR family)
MTDLPLIARKFILHWGEMGMRWGINRTMAQIHALLFLCETLELARSNVSVALRELQGWGIVKLVHLAGDRRDHFESMKDVFEMFRVIANERRRREVDPTLRLINDCLDEAGKPKAGETHVRERLAAMKEFFELSTTFAAQLERMPTGSLVKVARMGDKALKLLGLSG